MDNSSNIKHFQGHFSYLLFNDEGESTESEERVLFEMTLNFEDHSFSGVTVDEESRGLFDKPITVNGFVEKDLISFVVMYPHNYFIDENGVCRIDYENDYPGCNYQGYYDSKKELYLGNWSIEIDQHKITGLQTDSIIELYEGLFEMKEIKED